MGILLHLQNILQMCLRQHCIHSKDNVHINAAGVYEQAHSGQIVSNLCRPYIPRFCGTLLTTIVCPILHNLVYDKEPEKERQIIYNPIINERTLKSLSLGLL